MHPNDKRFLTPIERDRSNADLEDRLVNIERKVDILTEHMQRALGAWLFIKVMGAIAVGITIIATFLAAHNPFK